jgi:NADPH:quinone reductase-like Zn-dependent oxidoreductase
MPDNVAAWISAPRAKLKVGPAPDPVPRADEIVVRARALAINPVDWITQAIGALIFSYIKYPFILGSDVAGEVVSVGSEVTRFKIGDRVLAHAVGSDPNRNNAAEGAFQSHVVVLGHMATTIPDAMTFEAASVVPLGLSTAACGLYEKDFLALDWPTVPGRPRGQAVVIWGGSTSVGSNAIQLAVASGYEVFATASPRNFDYVRRLGASHVFDYNNKTVIKEMIAALKGKSLAGALAIGATSGPACLDIVRATPGAKALALASIPGSFDSLAEGSAVFLRFLAKVPALVGFNITQGIKARMAGVRMKFIFGSSLHANEVGPMIYADYLPKALAADAFIAAPEPQVAGHGLEALQAALDVQRHGVSARKVVVTL